MSHRAPALTPENSLFILVSFEGPDRYAQAGGLAVRVTGLAETLAGLGYETHLVFVGDPALPGEEYRLGHRLILHRWAQWVSAYHPTGVYQGEEEKRLELTASLPSYLLEHLIAPAAAAGRTAVVLSEEWQTAELPAFSVSCWRELLRGIARSSFGMPTIPTPSTGSIGAAWPEPTT